MKSTGASYDHTRSFRRLDEILDSPEDEILDSPEVDYQERDDLPSRDDLTYTNGFYVRTAALFVDIRNSSALPDRYNSFPKLAKLYRAFISEVTAVLDGTPECEEVNIVGDGVWGVFDARWKSQVDSVLDAAARVSSLLDVLNDKLIARGHDRLYVGIGLDWRALMLKSGSYGSGISEVVYMGNVVNQAAKLCSYGEADLGYGLRRARVVAGSGFVSNLDSDTYRDFFTYDANVGAYAANIEWKPMKEWRDKN